MDEDSSQLRPLVLSRDALSVLACLDANAVRSRAAITQLTGLPAITVAHHLVRLTSQGYLEETTDRRYRLAPRPSGDREIVVTSLQHNRTTSKRQGEPPADAGPAA